MSVEKSAELALEMPIEKAVENCTCNYDKKKAEQFEFFETSIGDLSNLSATISSNDSSNLSITVSSESSSDEISDEDYTDDEICTFCEKLLQRKVDGRKSNKTPLVDMNTSFTKKKKHHRKRSSSACSCFECNVSKEECSEYVSRKNARSRQKV